MKTVKLNAFDNPFVYGVNNKEYLVFNIDNETQTLKFQSLIGDLKVKTANILFKANSLPAKLYEMVVDDDILTFTLPSVLTGYNSSMYVYLLLNYSDDLSTSDLYTFKLADKGSSTFNFKISSICESNISTIVSEEIKNERVAKSILDTVSNYEFDKLQHAQQSLSLVENAFSSTLEKRIDLFNSAYDKANATKSNTTGDINDSDIDIPSSNTDSDLKDYVENVKTQMSERLKDVTVVSQQIKDEMAQEKQSFLGSSLIFQQDLKQERDIISAYGESTRQHMDQEFNEVKDFANKVFVDFSKNIPDLDASIKQVNDKIVATDNKVGTLNTKVTNVENDVTELEKMHNEVTQTINNGKLISLYSNSLDFGDYDYSGNPNLLSPITANHFASGTGTVSVNENGELICATNGTERFSNYNLGTSYRQTALVEGQTYTISMDICIDEIISGSFLGVRFALAYLAGGNVMASTTNLSHERIGEWQTVKGTMKVKYPSTKPQQWYVTIRDYGAPFGVGQFRVKNFKLEKGAVVTPNQPNLLDAPYYLSKVPLGKNIADPTKTFPINSSSYEIYRGNMKEELVIGQTYTITLKGTKPASQTFTAYNFWNVNLGDLKPVEGLTDVWSLTFTPAKLEPGLPKDFRIFQMPKETIGACQIDWFKIEKGDTRTPNIESYKYKGVSLRNTIDPTAFDWQEQIVADVSTLKEQVNTLTPKVDNSQLFKLTKDDGNTIKVDYMSPKPTSFLALAKNTGFYSISTAESKLMSDYNELPALLQNTFLFINNYPPRDGFIIQEITGGEISTQLVHKYYRRIEPDGTYKNWNKVITDKDVSKMKTLYSNCIDFGGYDYSGNPNLFVNTLKSSDFNKGSHGSLTDDSGMLYFTSEGTGLIDRFTLTNMPAVVSGKTYTISAKLRFDEGTTGDINKLRLTYRKQISGTVLLEANSTAMTVADLGKEITIKGTAMVTYNITELNRFFLSVSFSQNGKINGGFKLYDIKIEEGSTATPYQPNLLDAPYYLSKVPLGENIKDKGTVFPIKTSAYAVYSGANTEPYVVGQKYIVSMKATKPVTPRFVAFMNGGSIKAGDFVPVEGLTDVWQTEFTVTQAAIDSGVSRTLAIYQFPNEAKGPVQIDWLKIEKGDTRTPNIDEYKYKGFSVKLSNNPNDYEWSIDRQYGEKRLDKMVNTTDPQSIGGIKNFLETPLVKGKEVLYGNRLFEGFYGSGTVHSNFKTKTRLGVGGLVMDDQPRLPEPFEWNSGRWQATVIRDVTFYCEGTMYIDTGANMGKYIYIANWKDEAQTQYASGNPAGMGIAADNGYWYRNLKNFSWIVTLKKGDKFSIGIELAADKEVWNIQIRTLHIKELIPPLE